MNVRKSLKTLLLFGAVLSNTACQSFPKITVCVSDPEAGGFQCSDADGVASFLPYPSTGNYVCRSPEDEQLVIEWIKRTCNKK